MQLVLATRNTNKSREFRELLGSELEVRDLNSLPEIPIPEETGRTFEENAALKAVAVSLAAGRVRVAAATGQDRPLFVAADDSGLEVDALGGAPGIYSARYAGKNASDRENVDKLLRELEQVWRNFPSCDSSKWQVGNLPHFSARFRCVIALARGGKLLRTFEGVVEGRIVNPPRGQHGFGYDPIFQPNGFQQTFAEMPSRLKNKISHRARAIAALLEALRR